MAGSKRRSPKNSVISTISVVSSSSPKENTVAMENPSRLEENRTICSRFCFFLFFLPSSLSLSLPHFLSHHNIQTQFALEFFLPLDAIICKRLLEEFADNLSKVSIVHETPPCFLLWLHPQHVDVLGPGIESKPQLRDLCCSNARSFNPPIEARDRTRTAAAT